MSKSHEECARNSCVLPSVTFRLILMRKIEEGCLIESYGLGFKELKVFTFKGKIFH